MVVITLLVAVATPAGAQAVQAARGVSRIAQDAEQRAIGDAAAQVRVDIDRARTTVLLDDTAVAMRTQRSAQDVAAAQEELSTLVAVGEALLEARDDPSLFRELLERYGAIRLRASAALDTPSERAHAATKIQAIPQLSTVVPDVAFTFGPEGAFGQGEPSLGVALGTNVAGAVAGSLFSAIGSEPLQEYFQDNVSIGTMLPAAGRRRIAAQLGLGLGGLALGAETTVRGGIARRSAKVTVWPVLQMEQNDTSDAALPRDLLARSTEQRTWTSVSFLVAIVLSSEQELADRIADREFVFIPTVGVRLPYYFPGGVYDALTALFSERRTDFERAGRAQLVLGVSVPLPKVRPADAR